MTIPLPVEGAGGLRVLIACEFSATVRDAFRRRGHDAWSCDRLPTEGDPRWHIQTNVLECLDPSLYRNHLILPGGVPKPWDLIIAHPPCTYLANSGAKHLYLRMKKEYGFDIDRLKSMEYAARFYADPLNAPAPSVCVENPIMLGRARSVIERYQKRGSQRQIVHPWQYGHGEQKATVLELINLPPLVPTNIVEGREQRIWRMGPSPTRQKERSRTYEGIAAAMAEQWGGFLLKQRGIAA